MTPLDTPSATRRLHFRDLRSPLELQHLLEREFMVLVPARLVNDVLECHGSAAVNGALCQIRLLFVAALPRTNAYLLELTLVWADLPSEHHDYHRQTAESWLDLWTRDFTAAAPPRPGEGSASRYAELTASALSVQAHAESAEAVQQKILAALRRGANFSTAHKEGGTLISWKGGAFVRQDYGESETHERFPNETAFLAFLRGFYDGESRRSWEAGKLPSDADRWQLILRLLLPPV